MHAKDEKSNEIYVDDDDDDDNDADTKRGSRKRQTKKACGVNYTVH